MPRKQKRDDLEVDPREVLRLIPRSLKRRRKADEETMKEMEMPSLEDLGKLLPGGGGKLMAAKSKRWWRRVLL